MYPHFKNPVSRLLSSVYSLVENALRYAIVHNLYIASYHLVIKEMPIQLFFAYYGIVFVVTIEIPAFSCLAPEKSYPGPLPIVIFSFYFFHKSSYILYAYIIYGTYFPRNFLF